MAHEDGQQPVTDRLFGEPGRNLARHLVQTGSAGGKAQAVMGLFHLDTLAVALPCRAQGP